MSDRRAQIAALPTTTPNKSIRVGLLHSNGRLSLCAYPVKDDGGGMESFILTSMQFRKVEDAPRFNRKRLDQLAAQGDKLPGYQDVVKAALDCEQLTLA